jgi:hypothetical protein
MPQETNVTLAYEAPTLTVVGSLHEHTLRGKSIAEPSDGDYLSGEALKTVIS